MNLEKLSQDARFLENPIVTLAQPHADARGQIIPLVDEDIKSAVLIESKRNTVRANHYHKTDWHYCYLLTGSMDYYWRPAKTNVKPKKIRIIQGQLFFTPPLVDHAMHFLEDSSFICLGKNPRDQATYEADIERVDLFQPGNA